MMRYLFLLFCLIPNAFGMSPNLGKLLSYYPAIITVVTSPWWHITITNNEPFDTSITTFWLFGKRKFEHSNKIKFTVAKDPNRLWDTATVLYVKGNNHEKYNWKDESLEKMHQNHKRDHKIERKIDKAHLQRIELIINSY